MNQWLVILLGALAVAAIVIGIASVYTMSTVSKMPEQNEIIHLFIAGSIVGATLSWIISNGYLHGYSMASMLVSDVKSVAKEIGKEVGLKGGDEVTTGTVSNVQQMVGGFLGSMGINSSSLQELTVGMPSF